MNFLIAENKSKNRNGNVRAALLAGLAALLVGITGCGEPGAPGLGVLRVNDGAEASIEFLGSAPMGNFCDFSGVSFYVPIVVFQDNANLGDVGFGDQDLGEVFDPPPSTTVIVDSDVVLTGVDSNFRIWASNNPSAPFFSDTSLIVDTSTGFGVINTGDNGVAYVIIEVLSGLVSADNDAIADVTFSPPISGAGFQVEFTFTCDEI